MSGLIRFRFNVCQIKSFALHLSIMAETDSKVMPPDAGELLGPCPVCGREMVAGTQRRSAPLAAQVPGRPGGAAAAPDLPPQTSLPFYRQGTGHDLCHPEAVRQHPQMQTFIQWVRRRPPEFIDRHKKPGPRK